MLATLRLAAVLAAAAARNPALDSPAYGILETLVTTDQRYAGAPGRAKAIDRLQRMMEQRGLFVRRDAFVARDPLDGQPRPMVNLIGRLHSEANCRLLLGSHFDVRHVAEEDSDAAKRGRPIPGANDGSSGVAVLLDLADRLRAQLPARIGVDVALFDGEEMGYPKVGGYCLGSAHYAGGPLSWNVKPKFGIILDMVCDPRGIYHYENNSMRIAPALVRAVWQEGRKRAPEAFDPDAWLSIGDDHIPLSEAGVPSILLIGFNYPQWHTTADTIDRCSPARLNAVEGALEAFILKRAGPFLRCGP